MKLFDNLADLAAELGAVAVESEEAERRGLEAAAKIIEKEAKASLGTDRNGWPELADSTQIERARAGYSPNDPLLRSKTLQGAITHDVESAKRALVGVPGDTGEVEPEGALVADVAADMEWGTMRAPPRPFMGPAAMRKGEEAAHAVAGILTTHLKGA
jgi:HK97 gp10 family phage protein